MKTFDELKDIIEDCIDWDGVMYETGGAKYNEAWKELEEAYEKQIPKKVDCGATCGGIILYGKCPNCHVTYSNANNYCSNCSQALDWSEE